VFDRSQLPDLDRKVVEHMETCTTCNGDGRCLSCGGSGKLGTWVTHRCDTCHGRRVCGRCNGSGEVKKRSR
jgi:hypothetical protein